MPPLQLLVSHISIDVPQGYDRHVVYVDVSWRGKSFRTTAKAKQFDPLNPKKNLVDFSSDEALMTAPPPLTSDDVLQVRGRRCEIFGDRDFQACHVRIMALPLIRDEPLTVRLGMMSMRLKALNFGGDRAPGSQPRHVDDALDLDELGDDCDDALALQQTTTPASEHPPEQQQPMRKKRKGRSRKDVPRDTEEGNGEPSPPVAVQPATFDTNADPIAVADEEAAACNHGAASPLSVTAAATMPSGAAPGAGPLASVVFGDAASQMSIHTHENALGPLTWSGSPPPLPPAKPRLPEAVSTASPAASGGARGLFGSIVKAAQTGAHELRGAIELAMLRQHFPELASALPYLHAAFAPRMLNGHGTPIEGHLYALDHCIAFHGPMMHFVVPFASIAHIRRVRVFSDAALQIFAVVPASEGQLRLAMQLQEFDGVVSKLGSALGLRGEEKIAAAHRLLVDLWQAHL